MGHGRVKKALDGHQAHIRTLRGIVLFLTVACIGMFWGWKSAPDRIMIDIPPDLRSGSTRGITERHPFNVYAFGIYIWQQLNNWPLEGVKDYKDRINSLSCYFTPGFKAYLETDYENRRTRYELTRTRAVQEMTDRPYEAKRVFVETPASWIAYYDMNVREDLKGAVVKDVFIRFPIRVVQWDVNPECNQWGLALDGFYGQPTRLEEAKQDDVLVVDPNMTARGE